MGKIIDLTGQTFGRLTVIRYAGIAKNRKALWECECSCGNRIVVQGTNLRNGNTSSCGCLHKERFNGHKHGLKHTRLYSIWCAMKARCSNPHTKSYRNYGGRGIAVCEEWNNDFMCFYNWAMSNGYEENLSIDRINVNGNYEPSNCRWTDTETQANNTRTNRKISYKEKTLTVAQWEKLTGLPIWERLHYGWTLEECFERPLNDRRSVFKYNGKAYTVAELSKLFDVPYTTLYTRLVVRHWDIEKALNKTKENSDEN